MAKMRPWQFPEIALNCGQLRWIALDCANFLKIARQIRQLPSRN
jgi:hypothetical protein